MRYSKSLVFHENMKKQPVWLRGTLAPGAEELKFTDVEEQGFPPSFHAFGIQLAPDASPDTRVSPELTEVCSRGKLILAGERDLQFPARVVMCDPRCIDITPGKALDLTLSGQPLTITALDSFEAKLVCPGANVSAPLNFLLVLWGIQDFRE